MSSARAEAADDFAAFEAQARSDGFDEVLVREWAPGQVVACHGHPFALRVDVVRGEVTITRDGATRTWRAGERFELPLEALHAEVYGPEGATFWVARRRA